MLNHRFMNSQPLKKIRIAQKEKLKFAPDVVVREETLQHEKRTVVMPDNIATLTKNGTKVALVDWYQRCFTNKEYFDAVKEKGSLENFSVMSPNDWKHAPLCSNSLILRTKEKKIRIFFKS